MKIVNIIVGTLILWLTATLPSRPAESVAFVLRDPLLPDSDPPMEQRVAGAIRDAGYIPETMTVAQLLKSGALSPAACRLLVLPHCRALPLPLAPVVTEYLKAGGHLVALGAPAWDIPLVKSGEGRWVSTETYGEKRALEAPPHPLFSFANGVQGWERSSDSPKEPTVWTASPASVNGRASAAMHVTISNLNGYDTLSSPAAQTPDFPVGQSVTIFSARGGPRTHSLAVEWEEKDGSRWIAPIALTERWRRYSLPPSAFKSWSNSPERAAQGFHPENARRFRVGLAFSHTGTVGGAHEYWISTIGAGPPEPDDAAQSAEILPPMETLAPRYKFYPLRGPLRLAAAPGQSLVTYAENAIDHGQVVSSHPRPSGAGFDKDRLWRWIPLLQASDSASGAWRGTPATLMLHAPGSAYPDGAWLSIAVTDPRFYGEPQTLQALTQAAARMRDGLFFLDAGADVFTGEPGRKIRLGARLVDLAPAGSPERAALVRLRVADRSGKVVFAPELQAAVAPGRITKVEVNFDPPPAWPAGGYTVSAELVEAGKAVDRLSHELNVYAPPAQTDFVQARGDGHFSRDGRLWRINGVNYMPSSGIAQEDGALYEQWMSRAAYDPIVIERDLSHIEALGMNAVSIFIYRQNLESQNLLDCLRRCRNHHLRVNLSLRPGILDTLRSGKTRNDAIDNFTAIVQRFHLEQDDTIFAFETDWEPNFGGPEARRRLDTAWSGWIQKRYGTLANAERAWGTKAPRLVGDAVTNPGPEALSGADSSAAKLAGDYRRFLDDWLAETYGAATKALHAIAPHQLVSFRMASTGNPGDDQRGELPYQFEGLAHAVDFLAPECYGRIGTEEGEQGIVFEIAYARALAPKLPVIWAEVGATAWNMAEQRDDPAAIAWQGKYLDTFYTLARQSGADGLFIWWYAGGFRVGENSDFGILNPDGTERPATEAILRQGKLFLNDPVPPAPNAVFTFSRDPLPDGVHGVFRTLREPFFFAAKQGKHPGLLATPIQ